MTKSNKSRIKRIVKRDGSKCHYCGCEINFENSHSLNGHTVDHIHPVIKGGDNSFDNTVLACRSCNSKKKDKHYQEFKMAIDTDATILFLMGDSNE